MCAFEVQINLSPVKKTYSWLCYCQLWGSWSDMDLVNHKYVQRHQNFGIRLGLISWYCNCSSQILYYSTKHPNENGNEFLTLNIDSSLLCVWDSQIFHFPIISPLVLNSGEGITSIAMAVGAKLCWTSRDLLFNEYVQKHKKFLTQAKELMVSYCKLGQF